MEHIRLDLVVGELELPALVVKLDELASRKALRVDERQLEAARASRSCRHRPAAPLQQETSARSIEDNHSRRKAIDML
jgi:hypothetical protein